ncbi:MAG TPA: RNA polymerase factor sigma-54 [Gemmatimonadales bacterium]
MKTGLQQTTGLRQELRINPRLYQAMDMLYMPMMELQQHLKQELLINPFLELVEPEEEEQPAENATAEQEKEKAEKDAEIDWEEILLNGFDVGGMRQQFENQEYVEPVTVETRDLSDHLREQLHLLELTPRQEVLGEELLGHINDEGYLATPIDEVLRSVNQLLTSRLPRVEEEDEDEDVDEDDDEAASPRESEATAADAPFSPPGGAGQGAAPTEFVGEVAPGVPYFTVGEVEEALRIIQRLDPPGIGARDLRECILLQMTEDPKANGVARKLVEEAFDDLKAHRWNDLAKRYGVEPGEVQAAADTLARYDPKPGLQFSTRSDGYIIPDLVVEKVDGQYHVFLNDTGVPRLRLSRSYQELARDRSKLTQESREFITTKMNSANWMIQAIEQRRQTMLKVMNFIVDRQRPFFEKGVEYLRPLTLREVAEVIGMHESTVSRVTNEKYVQTPRGVLPLKFFFSSALATASGEEASARSIRAKLQKMVGEEDPAKPLTDQQIVHLFQEQGIQIARRTVAKYRDQLGILPARMRKRV